MFSVAVQITLWEAHSQKSKFHLPFQMAVLTHGVRFLDRPPSFSGLDENKRWGRKYEGKAEVKVAELPLTFDSLFATRTKQKRKGQSEGASDDIIQLRSK